MVIALLDFDGTVANTMPALTVAAVRIISETYHDRLAFAPNTEADARRRYLSTVGAPFIDQLEELFPGDPRNVPAADRFLDLQTAVYKGAQLFPSTQAAIDLLLENDAEVGIVSSSYRVLTCQVLARELPRTVENLAILGREDGTKCEQVRELAFTHSNATLVGDTPRDRVIAQQAGVRFIGVEHTFPMGDFDGFRVAPDILAAARELVG